jgi:hypothetical protein
MNGNNADKLTLNEFLALFGQTADEARCMSSADSEEYITLMTYLLVRSRPTRGE